MKTLQERTLEAEAEGFKTGDLARAAKVTPSAVSQWKSGAVKTLKAESASGLATLTGWSVAWWATGRGPREAVGRLAHPVRQSSVTIPPQQDPQRVEWGAMKANDLPEDFCVEVPDNAMADRVPKGYLVRFDRRLKPRAEDGVLVADSSGQWFFRVFMPGSGDHFSAIALKAGYPPLDSVRDGLTVIGVRTWHGSAERWG